MSIILRRNGADHPKDYVRRVMNWRVYSLMSAMGLGVPVLYPVYVHQRHNIRLELERGLPTSEGSDPLDRLLNGVEEAGEGVRFGKTNIPHSSKFAAVMVLALRAALGRLEKSQVNIKLAEAEYRRISRARDVRLCVLEAHRAIVLDTFFNEGLFDEVVASQQRLPAWLRWLIGFYEPKEPAFARF